MKKERQSVIAGAGFGSKGTKLSIRLKPINRMKEKRRRNKESWMNHR